MTEWQWDEELEGTFAEARKARQAEIQATCGTCAECDRCLEEG